MNTNAATFQPAAAAAAAPNEAPPPAAAAATPGSALKQANPPRRARPQLQQQTKRDHELHGMSEVLEAELLAQTYDCIICFSAVLRKDRVWSCLKCYRVYHLHCVRKWAAAAAGVGTAIESHEAWRCPGCQNVHDGVPSTSFCFCGKTRDPTWRPNGPPPHTCGELCSKTRDVVGMAGAAACTHTCSIPCHAGPCPPCPVMVSKACACGATTQSVRCAARATPITCTAQCDKRLPCGRHRCESKCHAGACDPCGTTQTQHCYCSSATRETDCGTGSVDDSKPDDENPAYFSCGNRCARPLACGNHSCEELCHKGPCGPCRLLPSIMTTCGCGKQRCYTRTSCTDPVFLCGDVCNKSLHCRHKSKIHRCHQRCHTGPCPPCALPVSVPCLCTVNNKDFPAAQCHADLPGWRCTTLCDKLKSCRRHRCNETCCPLRTSNEPVMSAAQVAALRVAAATTDGPLSLPTHECMLLCRKPLRCGTHTCEQLCHTGPCPPCTHMITDDLVCECGQTVLRSPLPCGTHRPICPHRCAREHACGHAPTHTCHYEENCPPCPVLVSKICVGGHNNPCPNTPCHISNPTCRADCHKPLSCGVHHCPAKCHAGACTESLPRELVAQPLPPELPASSMWTEMDPSEADGAVAATGVAAAGGADAAGPELEAAAVPAVPAAFAAAVVVPTCGLKCGEIRECGHLCQAPCHPGRPCPPLACQEKVRAACPCGMRREMVPCLFGGLSMEDERRLFALDPQARREVLAARPLKKHIACDKLCPVRQQHRLVEERNRRVAEALGLEGSEARVRYPDTLVAFARSHLPFVRSIEHTLDALATAPKAKQHSFPPMRAEERKFIGELAVFYGLSFTCFDAEPHRNIMVYRGGQEPRVPHPRLSETLQ